MLDIPGMVERFSGKGTVRYRALEDLITYTGPFLLLENYVALVDNQELIPREALVIITDIEKT